MRLLIAVFQTVIIVGVGSLAYDVQISGSWPLIGGLILIGSLAFIALGYVIASFAKTEEAANGMTSVVQFPLMFLSGTFFPIDAMPDFLKTVARALPLTYLGDGLRQVMVDGTPFAPLWVCFAFLAGVVAGELRGLSLERSLVLAARVAALTVGSPDLAPVEPVELDALLSAG